MDNRAVKAVICFFLATAVAACKKQRDMVMVKAIEHKVMKMPEGSNEFYIPTRLWDKITGGSFEKAAQSTVSFSFAPLEVILEDKSEGVLKQPGFRLEFPNGGGELDLSQFIKNTRGTFRLKFGFEGLSQPETFQAFYVSKAKRRKIDNEYFGTGCNTFLDIKNYITQVNDGKGIELNVTRDRHLSAVGGHFIFSYKKDKQTYVSQIEIVDSKKPDLFCP